MCRNGPVSSSRTGSTPRTRVYHGSLTDRSVTVTATCVMAGMVMMISSVIGVSADVGVSAGDGERCGDGVPGCAGAQGGQQQDPGLERVKEPGGDEPAVLQVALGAREGVGRGQDRPGAGPGGQDDRDLGGDVLQDRRERRGDVADAHA